MCGAMRRIGVGRVIEVRDVKKWIQNGSRRVEILKGISLQIPAGQFVAIVGASGSGKSTLLGLLAGLDTPSEGEIWLDGTPIHNLAETELAAVRGSKIGFVFQSYQLIPTLTALENVLLPFELNVAGSGLQRARDLLDAVGLAERVDHYPIQLSGGEQQRVALARAFVVNPPIVMADEPTGNLDSTKRATGAGPAAEAQSRSRDDAGAGDARPGSRRAGRSQDRAEGWSDRGRHACAGKRSDCASC